MRILGVDPGLRVTGYGVIEDSETPYRIVEAGVVRSTARLPLGERLLEIYSGLRDLIAETKPEVLVLEKIFAHYKHPATAFLMGHARGVICLAASEARISVCNMPSTRVKKSILSDGHASKDRVQRAVQAFYGVKRSKYPTDVSDALAIAASYAQGKRFLGQPLRGKRSVIRNRLKDLLTDDHAH